MPTSLHTEIELKYRLLGEDPIRQLLGVLESDLKEKISPKVLQQCNYFFDTKAHALRGADISFRIRDENGAYTLTLKGPALENVEHRHVSSRTEFEIALKKEEAQRFIENKASIVKWLMDFELGPEESSLQKRTFEHLRGQIKELELQDHIAYVGSFQNMRQVVPIVLVGEKLALELDTTTFPGDVVHHELELELPSEASLQAAESYVLTLFARGGILYKDSSGKGDRFFKMLALGL